METQKVEVAVAQRASDGKFLPGSAGSPGRPPLGQTSLHKLLQAVVRVESKLNKKLLDHYIERAFKSDPVLVSVMKKLIPDLSAIAYIDSTPQMDDAIAESIRQKLLARTSEHLRIAKEEQS